MKVSFSADIILCDRLGLKHQLTNYLTRSVSGRYYIKRHGVVRHGALTISHLRSSHSNPGHHSMLLLFCSLLPSPQPIRGRVSGVTVTSWLRAATRLVARIWLTDKPVWVLYCTPPFRECRWWHESWTMTMVNQKRVLACVYIRNI